MFARIMTWDSRKQTFRLSNFHYSQVDTQPDLGSIFSRASMYFDIVITKLSAVVTLEAMVPVEYPICGPPINPQYQNKLELLRSRSHCCNLRSTILQSWNAHIVRTIRYEHGCQCTTQVRPNCGCCSAKQMVGLIYHSTHLFL